jgi:hypothetical protein
MNQPKPNEFSQCAIDSRRCRETKVVNDFIGTQGSLSSPQMLEDAALIAPQARF